MPGAGADAVRADPALEVTIAEKRFAAAGRVVLRDIAFGAPRGAVLALFGPSGAGKTSTLRIVVGLDAAFRGRIIRPPGRLGMMFQEPRLVPWLTVGDNLRLVMPEDAPPPDVPALLAEVGLPDAALRRPRELSLGMARRAALARALAVAPSLLVLDEPFASLDPQLAASLATVIRARANRDGMTVLLTTHDLDQVMAVADRVLVLSGVPATLAADLPVPRGPDAAARTALRAELLGRFPFLQGHA
jgi:ABC-type nitrate/sulfonate/bicarbonate transport system ATPase subunit